MGCTTFVLLILSPPHINTCIYSRDLASPVQRTHHVRLALGLQSHLVSWPACTKLGVGCFCWSLEHHKFTSFLPDSHRTWLHRTLCRGFLVKPEFLPKGHQQSLTPRAWPIEVVPSASCVLHLSAAYCMSYFALQYKLSQNCQHGLPGSATIFAEHAVWSSVSQQFSSHMQLRCLPGHRPIIDALISACELPVSDALHTLNVP